MCGRFTLAADQTTLSMTFPGFNIPEAPSPRYNIAPSQPVAVVANRETRDLEFYKWGLIPFWAKDPAIGNRMINARAESLGEKAAFKHAYKRRRCVILADGFYEWHRPPGEKHKIPVRIQMRSGAPFAFAGLWESWKPEDAVPVLSCAIITCEPNALMAKIHPRMPVILDPEDFDRWLDPAPHDPGSLDGLLRPYDAEAMTAYPVSTLVNNPLNDDPGCIEPAGEADFLRH